MKTVRSMRWGYARIIAGTILGGILGFYVMHRVEISYKVKMPCLTFLGSSFAYLGMIIFVNFDLDFRQFCGCRQNGKRD